jgi:hypothetical protein
VIAGVGTMLTNSGQTLPGISVGFPAKADADYPRYGIAVAAGELR